MNICRLVVDMDNLFITFNVPGFWIIFDWAISDCDNKICFTFSLNQETGENYVCLKVKIPKDFEIVGTDPRAYFIMCAPKCQTFESAMKSLGPAKVPNRTDLWTFVLDSMKQGSAIYKGMKTDLGKLQLSREKGVLTARYTVDAEMDNKTHPDMNQIEVVKSFQATNAIETVGYSIRYSRSQTTYQQKQELFKEVDQIFEEYVHIKTGTPDFGVVSKNIRVEI